ncbi:hypothetical protein [Variovorax boronicumulans]|uniref:hypothetical protein n=1 Tax=Variovorax boronicumulans TaxID=436515 RepID=UPI0012E6967A|nr:hypothetical protein [Variovorax boronicumulans]GER11120.1 hypothetical protein VHAB30_22850 [Variovorax boronicumulans]
MTLKTFGWLLVLLLACLAGFIGTAVAMMAGAAWAFGLLIVVWGLFLLAELLRRVPPRDVAWALGVGYGIGVIRWLDVPVEAGSGTQWLMLGLDLLVLVFFGLIAPAILGLIAQRWAPRPELPVEKPATPEQLRRWGPRD